MKTTTDRFISHREVSYVPFYRLTCEHTDDAGKVIESGWGYAFDCDAAGNVDETKLAPLALANLREIRAGLKKCTRLGVERYRDQKVVVPAVIRCDCGKHLTLNDTWAQACECGREYNGSGQLLAPRSQWGEETGEEGQF